jgi:hypothetical protein
MAGSEDKQKAHENKFAHDSEIQFKVQARRNKLLGLWAAGKMGLSVDESETFAKNMVVEGLKAAGDENIISKLASSFSEHGLEIAEIALRAQIEILMAEAKDQILSET